jgi:integrase/recombinase XerD
MSATSIREHAEAYLAMRRALGFKLTTFGPRLLSFVGYLQQRGASVITTDTALAWATATPRSTDQVHWSRRLMVVRSFARHLKVLDPATEVPPADILPHHYRRITPHLYTPGEIAALLDAAAALRPALRALTYQTLLSLLAVTGLRTGEACRLDRADVDLDDGVLSVGDSKFGKSRQVPVHASTVAGLRGYGQARDRLCATTSTPAFLVSTRGTRLDAHNLSHTFAGLVDAAGIGVPHGQRRPRLLSRSGARFRCCHRSVSPGRSPNPPYRSLGNGLSTVSVVRRGSWLARGLGSCCPGRCNGRPSPSRSGSTQPRPPRYATARWRRSGGGGAGPSSSRGVSSACGRVSRT